MSLSHTRIHNRYDIVRLIEEGGQGSVYEALDTRLDCRVALKYNAGVSPEQQRAFEREARLLANLRHPAMPRVTDYFSDELGQFLVMDFVPGNNFARMLERRGEPFPPEDVLEWADRILDALEYLHTRQPPVLHRDIKPENIKLMPSGEVMLLDFGLAKGNAGSQAPFGGSESVFGFTLTYSSLEQIQGTGTDARSDLFALAATLYHLVAGVPPADARSRASALYLRKQDPLRPPSVYNPAVSHSLDAALVKALAISRNERHESAAAFRLALRASIATSIREATPRAGIPAVARHSLALSSANVDRLAEHRRWQADIVVKSLSFTPDEELLVVAGANLQLWNARSGARLRTLEGHRSQIKSAACSPSGALLASASYDHTIRLWQLNDGTPLRMLTGHTSFVQRVAWSPDGQTLASVADDRTLRLWRASDGKLLWSIAAHSGHVRSLAFAPDGQSIATGGADRCVRLWRASDGAPLRTLDGHSAIVRALAFTPDGAFLASASDDKSVRLWRPLDGALIRVCPSPTLLGDGLEFSPDGALLAASGEGIKFWRVQDGALLHMLGGHSAIINALVFNRNGTTLATGSFDTTVRLWNVRDGLQNV